MIRRRRGLPRCLVVFLLLAEGCLGSPLGSSPAGRMIGRSAFSFTSSGATSGRGLLLSQVVSSRPNHSSAHRQLEPVGVIDRRDERSSGLTTHPGDRHHTLDLWIFLGIAFQLLLASSRPPPSCPSGRRVGKVPDPIRPAKVRCLCNLPAAFQTSRSVACLNNTHVCQYQSRYPGRRTGLGWRFDPVDASVELLAILHQHPLLSHLR